jgi:hypothetical protein
MWIRTACSTTVGVQRQYTGTAGRIENAQVAVYLRLEYQAGKPGDPGREMEESTGFGG